MRASSSGLDCFVKSRMGGVGVTSFGLRIINSAKEKCMEKARMTELGNKYNLGGIVNKRRWRLHGVSRKKKQAGETEKSLMPLKSNRGSQV